MTWQSIIDQMKEWVLSKAYATIAYVDQKIVDLRIYILAKGYATEAWVTLRITIAYDALLAIIDGLECFVDRGDPAALDFILGDFVQGFIWQDLDLSGIVPAGAKAVVIRLSVANNLVGSSVFLRRNGNANFINCAGVANTSGSITIRGDVTVALDENRIIEYLVVPSQWLVIDFAVAGWWF